LHLFIARQKAAHSKENFTMAKERSRGFTFLVMTSVVLCLFSGCNLLVPASVGYVNLSILIENGPDTIQPELPVSSYLISLTGPGFKAPISITKPETTMDLAAGAWTISVHGRDENGNAVAVGVSDEVMVEAGGTTDVSILLGPKQSSIPGAIEVTVSWPATVNPSINGCETTLDGVQADAGTIQILPSSARYTDETLPGVYRLSMILKSGASQRAILAYTVLVYEGLTSGKTISLTEADFENQPAAPGGLAAAEGLGSLELAWTDNSDAETGFEVDRSVGNELHWLPLASLPANTTQYVDAAAPAGQSLYYRVYAVKGFGVSGYSNSAEGTWETPTAGGGGALTFSDVETTSIRVSWQAGSDDNSDTLQYRTVRSTSDNVRTVADALAHGTQVMNWTANASTANATGLSAGTMYWFNTLIRDEAGNMGVYGSSSQATGTGPLEQIIVDHTAVARYGEIPQYWIDQVKKMWFNLPGESHSQAYRTGLLLLEAQDPRFAVSVKESGTPEAYTEANLRACMATWNGSGWQYSYGEEDWFTNVAAVSATKAHLNHANTGNLQIAAMGFGWCWDMTWTNAPGGTVDPVYNVRWAGSSSGGPDGNRIWGLDAGDYSLTGNHVSMDTYLDATRQYMDYCAQNGFPTKVFFTTGPVDGYQGEAGYQRQLKHDHIRNYVQSNPGTVLFDYADIMAWSNSGEQNTLAYNGHSYQMIHADNLRNLAGATDPSIGHIGERGALRLGKAVWWMLARMAGWPG
jgi:hypothetical protein